MTEDPRFTVNLEHLKDFEFKVRFDWDDVPELVLDEPEPLGHQRGPNAARILAAAVGNCLSASLLFCLQKSRAEPRGIKTRVTGTLARNEKGRQRIGGLQVRIDLEGPDDQVPRLERCLGLYEDFCMITESVRAGIPVGVEVYDADGQKIAG
jgi:organic hydroperoxide reductase OsmC/OhrA